MGYTIKHIIELKARIRELEEEVAIYKDLCTAYRLNNHISADKALIRLGALRERKNG